MLDYEAKRRPHIADAIKKIDTMSLEEVKGIKVPLPWFTRALIERKHLLQGAKLADRVRRGHVDDPTGYVLRWTGQETWFQLPRSNHILVRPGDIIFRTNDGYWIDSIWTTSISHLHLFEFVENCTKSQYSISVRRNLLNRHVG